MNESWKKLLIMFVIGFLVGSMVVLIGGLALYNERYSDVICMPEYRFNKFCVMPFSGFAPFNVSSLPGG